MIGQKERQVTKEQLAELQELLDTATPAPWYRGPSEEGVECDTGTVFVCMKQEGPHGKYQEEHDARFIAALRNAAPQLLEAARLVELANNNVDRYEAMALQCNRERGRYLEALKEAALAEECINDRALRPGAFADYVFGDVTIRVGCRAATDDEAECLFAEEVPNEHV